MFDPDAPSAAQKGNQYLHWLITNIDLASHPYSLTTVHPYVGPSPPPGSGVHRYGFIVLKQASRLNLLNNTFKDRSDFNYDVFVAENQLEEVACQFFTVTS